MHGIPNHKQASKHMSHRDQTRFGQKCGHLCSKSTHKKAKQQWDNNKLPLRGQETDAESCGVKRRREKTPSIERHPLTKRERHVKAFESERCILHKERNCPHEDRVAELGFHSLHHSNLVHALVPMTKAIKKFQQQTTAVGKGWGSLRTLTSLDCLHVQRQKQLFLNA